MAESPDPFKRSSDRLCRSASDPREAFGVRPACWRFRATHRAPKREQAPRTPGASRHSVAVLPRCEICRLGRLEAAYHYPQFRNAVAANLQGIVSSSRAGLSLRSFRQPFTINPKSGSSNREIRNTRKDMNLQLEACSPRPSAGEAGLVVRTLGAPLFSAYFAYSAVPIAFFRLTRHNLGRSGMRPYQLPRTTRRFLSVSSAQSVVTHFEHGQFTVSS